LTLCHLLIPLPVSAQAITGVASVPDGGSVEIRGLRIRLHGIHALESCQLWTRSSGQRWRCGREFALALADWIGPRNVPCMAPDIARSGRIVAASSQDGADRSRWMGRAGWAAASRQFSQDYIQNEAETRRAGRNVWSGRSMMPLDWRRGS